MPSFRVVLPNTGIWASDAFATKAEALTFGLSEEQKASLKIYL